MARTKREAKAAFVADTKGFDGALKESKKELSSLRSELRLNAAQMKATGETTDALQKRKQLLQQAMEASRKKADALSGELEAARRHFGENSEEVRRLQQRLNDALREEADFQAQINAVNGKLNAQKTALENVAEKASKVGDKLTSVGKSMSKLSAGIVAVGAASVAAFNEVDEGADNAIKATGATGDAAKQLEASYKNVAGSIVGDFGDIGSTLGEVSTRFGYTGDELETATVKFGKFAEITGMDSTEAVKAVSRALNDAGIPLNEYDTLLDQLAKAGQTAGIDVATLSDSLSKNGSIMRSMGFNTEETIALLSQFELSGADASSMLTGMKKAMATWAKDGKDGTKEFGKYVAGIKDGSITASEAVEVFGTKAGPMLVDAIKSGKFEYEDLLTTIQGSQGTLESTFDGTVDGGYEMELAMQNAKVALGEVGNTLATTLTPFIQTATEKLKGFSNWWSGLSEKGQKTIVTIAGVVAAIGPVLVIMGTVASSITKIANAMKLAKTAITVVKTAMSGLNLTFLASPITWIVLAVVALVAVFVVLWNKCEGFRNFWINLWEKIKAVAAKVWQAIKQYFVAAWEAIKVVWDKVKPYFMLIWDNIKKIFSVVKSVLSGDFKGAWEAIKGIWNNVKAYYQGIWNGIKNVFAGVGQWFSNIFQKAKQGIVNAFSTVGAFFGNVVAKIKNVFGKVKDAILKPFRTAINLVKGLFNKLKLKFPNIKLPHFTVSPKGWKIGDLLKGSIPKLGIDWYAKGGIFTRPTVLETSSGLKGFGDAGYEAVLPIDRLRSYIAGAIRENVQMADLSSLSSAIEKLADRPIDMNINGRRFATVTAGDTDSVNGMRTRLLERGLALD